MCPTSPSWSCRSVGPVILDYLTILTLLVCLTIGGFIRMTRRAFSILCDQVSPTSVDLAPVWRQPSLFGALGADPVYWPPGTFTMWTPPDTQEVWAHLLRNIDHATWLNRLSIHTRWLHTRDSLVIGTTHGYFHETVAFGTPRAASMSTPLAVYRGPVHIVYPHPPVVRDESSGATLAQYRLQEHDHSPPLPIRLGPQLERILRFLVEEQYLEQ